MWQRRLQTEERTITPREKPAQAHSVSDDSCFLELATAVVIRCAPAAVGKNASGAVPGAHGDWWTGR